MWQIYHINVLYILHIFADSSTIDTLLQSSFKVQEPRRGDRTKDRVKPYLKDIIFRPFRAMGGVFKPK